VTQSCIFSGMEPDTEEHVIPDWLQRRFGLQRQRYHLPSSSALDYRHARVPATQEFNAFFGDIESRISQNRFVWEEVYLWLLKIHVGLMYRDTALLSDIRNPQSHPIVRAESIANQLQIFRRLVRSYMNTGTLEVAPSPPGSVFVLPSLSERHFDFQHSFTTGSIGINIGDFYVAASLWDLQTAHQFEYFDWVWGKENFNAPPPEFTAEQIALWYHHIQAVWLCNLGYWSFRWNINMYHTVASQRPLIPAFDDLPSQRPEDPSELASICETFGLSLATYLPNGKSIFEPLPSRLGVT